MTYRFSIGNGSNFYCFVLVINAELVVVFFGMSTTPNVSAIGPYCLLATCQLELWGRDIDWVSALSNVVAMTHLPRR